MLISKREETGIKYYNDFNIFIEYSNTMDNVYNNIIYYNLHRNCNILIVFDDMIPDMNTSNKFQPMVKELLSIRCKKLSISLVFIMQSYLLVPRDVILNSTHDLLMKISNKIQFPNIKLTYPSDIDYKDFLKIYRNCTAKQYSFLVIETILTSENLLMLRCNLLQEL